MAVFKPNHLLVHPTSLDKHETSSLIGFFRDKYSWLAPINRIDKPASGLVIFAKSPEDYRFFHLQLSNPGAKRYLAIVRGYLKLPICCFGKTPDESGKQYRDSKSIITPISTTECNWSVGKYPTSRYSLIQVEPMTGRWHQIKIHMAQLRHPIICDQRHGDVKHNNFFREKPYPYSLLLHAWKYQLHNRNGDVIELTSTPSNHWKLVTEDLGMFIPRTFRIW